MPFMEDKRFRFVYLSCVHTSVAFFPIMAPQTSLQVWHPSSTQAAFSWGAVRYLIPALGGGSKLGRCRCEELGFRVVKLAPIPSFPTPFSPSRYEEESSECLNHSHILALSGSSEARPSPLRVLHFPCALFTAFKG